MFCTRNRGSGQHALFSSFQYHPGRRGTGGCCVFAPLTTVTFYRLYWPGTNSPSRTFQVTDCPGRSVTIPVSIPFHCFPNGST
jgi:hypothetical protein